MGKLLIIVGIICIVAGLFLSYADKIPGLGKLPGDIFIERGNMKIFIPITSSILISILISFLLYLYFRLRQ
jgi:hypothetical protein